jgi:ribosomal protein L31
MKQQTHPNSEPTLYTCGNCGTEIPTVSTAQSDGKLESCSNCHPAYTGKAFKETPGGGRIDSFNNRYMGK